MVRSHLVPPLKEYIMETPKEGRYKLKKIWLLLGVFFIAIMITILILNNNSVQNTTSVKEEINPLCINDIEAPIISLNGERIIYNEVGVKLELEEPTVVDNCDKDISIVKTGEYDEATIGTYIINYTATDKAGNTVSIDRTIIVDVPNSGMIYLTFDDGPSDDTPRLLDILDKNNVKATFFITSSGDDSVIKREYGEGHSVALHSSSHAYAYIYQNAGNYFADLDVIRNRVLNITGYAPTLVRFPGGSSNTVSRSYDGGAHIMSYLANELERRGFTYFDWNVSSGDAGGATTAGEVCENVISRLYKNGNFVVLQHDTKPFSIDAVDCIIDYGKRNGYHFGKLSADSPTMHHVISN